MDLLKRARRPHRSEATKLVSEITTLLEHPEIVKRRVKTKLKLLLEIKEKLMDLDEKVLGQHVVDQSDEKVEEEETRVIREYREKIENAIDQAEEVLQETRPGSPAPSDSASNTEKKRNFKLPKIELKKYNGDLKDWLGFWGQFEKIHEDDTLHRSDKFQYLYQAMEKDSPARELVESYPQSAENYDKAVAALRDRFGNKDLLLQVYVRELLKLVISNVTKKEKIPLSTLYIKLESHLRSLATLDLAKADPATWLFPLVESSLDTETLKVWQRSPQMKEENTGEEKKTRLDLLMDFLKGEVQIEQRIQVAQTGFQQNTSEFRKPQDKPTKLQKKNREREEDLPTAAGLFSSQERGCIFCDGKHDSKTCFKAKGMTMEEKQAKMKAKGACYSCLTPGHAKKKCRSFVSFQLCPKKHATIICPLLHQSYKEAMGSEKNDNTQAYSNNNNASPVTWNQPQQYNTTSQQSSVDCTGEILLMTIYVNVSSGRGLPTSRQRLLIDTGCQRSCISTSVVEEIGSKPVESEMTRNVLFDGSVTKYAKTNVHKVTVSALDGKQSMELVFREKPKLGGGIPLVPVGPWMQELENKGIWMNGTHERESKEEIGLVIGSDFWWQIKTGNELRLTSQLGATETIFGWALSGTLPPTDNYAGDHISMFQVEEDITKLWKLDVLGIYDPISKLSKREEESLAMDLFPQTTSRQGDGRYVVKLPWVNGPQALPTNRKIAEQRLISTTRKLEKVGHYQAYNQIFMDWLAEDFIEEVKDPLVKDLKLECHYLCHHPVFKDSPTTPCRPVFDASCKAGRNHSLNDCLFKGPNFIELLPAVIMRWREMTLGVVSDIRKAFQMIVVSEEDRDFLRFLWWEEKGRSMKVFRHKRVVFGVNCSPFLLAAVLELHLKSCKERSDVAMKILGSLYVDNVVTSVNDYEEYADFKTEAVRIMDHAKMDLRQWECTLGDSSGINLIPRCGLELAEGDGIGNWSTKVLGMTWDKMDDTLSIILPDQIVPTFSKRGILSAVSKIFDPIGFTCPAAFTGKVLFQKAWRSKADWDSELDGSLRDEFERWITQLHELQKIKIPRHHQIHQADRKELHMYCDGSQLGYACAVFLKTQSGDHVMVQLIQAKSRLTPMEKATIPRLELCACFIGARLMHSVKLALGLHDIPTFLWSDSTTAIAWIRKNDDWGTFVGNRVKKILEVTMPEDWRHVAGVNNPADLLSRGCTPSDLVLSRFVGGTQLVERSCVAIPYIRRRLR